MSLGFSPPKQPWTEALYSYRNMAELLVDRIDHEDDGWTEDAIACAKEFKIEDFEHKHKIRLSIRMLSACRTTALTFSIPAAAPKKHAVGNFF